MPKREILIKKDVDQLNECAAELVIEIGNAAIKTYGSFSIALAGGSTPRSLYTLLSSERFRSRIDWTKAIFFFGDERNVPPDSADSNCRMANESLLEPLGIDPAKIRRWRTELGDVEAIAADYQTTLDEHLRQHGRLFDLILLGLGPDAHTASLFPHTAALNESTRLAVANFVPKLDVFRLTLTFPAMNSAANIVFLISGRDKAGAVANVLEGNDSPAEYPAQLVRPEKGDLYYLFDKEAASGLAGP